MTKIRPFYQLLFLLFVTLGIYYPSLFAPYNSLDDLLLVDKLLNEEGFNLSRHFSPGGTHDYFRPLLTLTFEIDKYVGGLEEAFMHLVNVLLHTLNVVLVYALAWRICSLDKQAPGWKPFLAASIFAVHPINSEAVNWIMGRTDLLAGVFVLLALLALFHSLESRSLGYAVLSAVMLLLGALCKETTLFLVPGACYLLFCRPLSGPFSWQRRWLVPLFYGVAIAVYFALRWGAYQVDRGLSHTSHLVAQATGIGPPPVAAVQTESFQYLDAATALLKASGFYATKLFQPLPLNFAVYRLDLLYILPGVMLIFVLAVLVWRRQLVGGLFILSASIATSALFIVMTGLAWTPIAERYMYIPCSVFSIALTLAVVPRVKAFCSQSIAATVVALVLAGGVWATTNRNMIWQDNLTLYQDAVEKSPGFAPAVNQLAMALMAHGQREEATQLLIRNKMSADREASLNVAKGYWAEGDYTSARDYLLVRLGDNPGPLERKVLEMLVSITTEYLNDVDDVALKLSGYRDILGWLERIKDISSTGFNYYRIGRINLLLGDQEAAQLAFARAEQLFPEDSMYKEPAAKLARDLAR